MEYFVHEISQIYASLFNSDGLNVIVVPTHFPNALSYNRADFVVKSTEKTQDLYFYLYTNALDSSKTILRQYF